LLIAALPLKLRLGYSFGEKTRRKEAASMDFGEVDPSQDRMKVLILTANFRITGEIALIQGARLTDYVVNAKPFLAVTDAEVCDLVGHRILSASFLNVHRDHVEVIVPIELIHLE
jgi:hypothetical protein